MKNFLFWINVALVAAVLALSADHYLRKWLFPSPPVPIYKGSIYNSRSGFQFVWGEE